MLNAIIKYRSLHWYFSNCEPLAVEGARSSARISTSDGETEKHYDEVKIAAITQKTATAIAVSIENKMKDLTSTSVSNTNSTQAQGQRQSYADVARNLSRFTGTINKIVAGTTTPQQPSCNPQDSTEVVQLVDEYIEREKRPKNLVVFNVPEEVKDDATGSKLSDSKVFTDIIKEEFNLIPKEQAAYRLGRRNPEKPRPLLIRIYSDDTSSRALIFRRAKDLRNSARWSRVYIVPDMTPNEREVDRKLRQELKSRREAGEANVVIRRGRIVCTQTTRESQPRDGHHD
ncbi:Hypp8776 [Branchiostoma lanceolatum]|uniref:Hypp8776 protein n=1 Tax=Branchiostoma lanceolatum TaxID=7740 RepID=A0A8J9Z9F5_BRALA|nr:Hypp8776 [Branchiostoma lanceolatum]